MHLLVAIWALVSAWKWGDWRNWEKYHTALMYFAMGNLLYNFLTAGHFLWKLDPDIFPNHSITELVYSFITFPSTALLFLSSFPEEPRKIILHYLKWIFIFIAVEWVFARTGRIQYQYGWSLGWSLVFDFTMFPMIRLFHKKPLIAYGISVAMCIFWVWFFDVPVNVPIEWRNQ